MGNNHSVIPTAIQGDNMVFLPGNTSQVIIASVTSNGFEILNQPAVTNVSKTLLFEHITIQVVNNIIGIPGTVQNAMQAAGLDKFEGLESSTGFERLFSDPGLTLFAPDDAAFGRDTPQIELANQLTLATNHVSTSRFSSPRISHPHHRSYPAAHSARTISSARTSTPPHLA